MKSKMRKKTKKKQKGVQVFRCSGVQVSLTFLKVKRVTREGAQKWSNFNMGLNWTSLRLPRSSWTLSKKLFLVKWKRLDSEHWTPSLCSNGLPVDSTLNAETRAYCDCSFSWVRRWLHSPCSPPPIVCLVGAVQGTLKNPNGPKFSDDLQWRRRP